MSEHQAVQGHVDSLVTRDPRMRWGVSIRLDGRIAAEHAPVDVLPTASLGKVLLLVEVARRIEVGELDADRRLAPTPDDAVADSGLWQHLHEPDLAVESLAVLVASVSDNLATNVLLRHVGLRAVADITARCGLRRTRMTDRIRDVRTPDDPDRPSEGCAGEWAALMDDLAAGRVVDAAVSSRVRRWLATGVDTSLVASALGLDPLAHVDGAVTLFHKTGADVGIRADSGHVRGPRATASYAVLASWDPEHDCLPEALDVMKEIGRWIASAVGA